MGYRWNKERVINGIKTGFNSDEDLRYSVVEKNNKKLFKAALYYFGSWKRAVKKAGISYKDIENKHEEKQRMKYLEEIKHAHENGVELDRGSLIENEQYSYLYWGVDRFYKGKFKWETALTDAGLDPYKIVKQKRWSKKIVKKRLNERHKFKKGLNSAVVEKEENDLYHAMFRYFGSYNSALKYSGFKPDKIRKMTSRSDTDIIKSIIFFYNKKENLNGSYIIHHKKQKKELARLFYVGSRRFHGWYNTVEKSGIDPKEFRMRKRWTTESVNKELEDMHKKNEPLNSSYAIDNYCDLYKAALRRHKRWKNVIENVLGLNYSSVKKDGKSLSPDEIIKEIQVLAKNNIQLNAGSILETEKAYLYHQANDKFDSGWDEALFEAGLNPEKIRFIRKRYTYDELKEMTYNLLKKGFDLNPTHVQHHEDTKKLYGAVLERYNSWGDFLDDIGIDSSKYVSITNWKDGGIKDYLLKQYPDGIVTGAMHQNRNFAVAVLSYYGTIKDAVEDASMVYSRRGKIKASDISNPDTVGRLYKFNKEFLDDIASGVYWFCKKRGMKTLAIDDLKNEAFIKMLDFLPEKPAKTPLREYVRNKIFSSLMELNAKHFKEIYKGDILSKDYESLMEMEEIEN
jgi:hypothetical protein